MIKGKAFDKREKKTIIGTLIKMKGAGIDVVKIGKTRKWLQLIIYALLLV